MEHTDTPISRLTDAECWERLATQTLGRLVTHVRDIIDIFPINYVVDGESIVLRTAEGSKLAEMMISEDVLFEVDDHSESDAWSVIVRGKAQLLESAEEIMHADSLPLRPMAPTLKRNYVRIAPLTLSGRYFEFGDEPPHDAPGLAS